ncbi:MAG: hypothetical protein ACXV3A_05910, partial [Kineosporiaceae bacterium]
MAQHHRDRLAERYAVPHDEVTEAQPLLAVVRSDQGELAGTGGVDHRERIPVPLRHLERTNGLTASRARAPGVRVHRRQLGEQPCLGDLRHAGPLQRTDSEPRHDVDRLRVGHPAHDEGCRGDEIVAPGGLGDGTRLPAGLEGAGVVAGQILRLRERD